MSKWGSSCFVKSYWFKWNDKYNLDLSDRRAKSTINYIVSKVSADKIDGKGFGESELKIDCELNCSDEELQTDVQNLW
jgi:hypothetical protein